MSDEYDATGTGQLDDEFLRRVQHLLKRAGLEIAVPEETRESDKSTFDSAGGGCNCPPEERCVRLWPSGARVCVPRR
jgi:hypothetical protein